MCTLLLRTTPAFALSPADWYNISADELSMHLLTTPLVYRLLSFKASPQRTKLLGIVLMTLFTAVMVTHMVMDEFLLHATTFGLAIYIIATRVHTIIPQQVPDPVKRRTLQNIALLGSCMYTFPCRFLLGAKPELFNSVLRPWLFRMVD